MIGRCEMTLVGTLNLWRCSRCGRPVPYGAKPSRIDRGYRYCPHCRRKIAAWVLARVGDWPPGKLREVPS